MGLGGMFKKLGRGLKKVLKVAAPMALNAFAPGAGDLVGNVIAEKDARKAEKKERKRLAKLRELGQAGGDLPANGGLQGTYEVPPTAGTPYLEVPGAGGPLASPYGSMYGTTPAYWPEPSRVIDVRPVREPASPLTPPTAQDPGLPKWAIPAMIGAGVLVLVLATRRK